MLHCIALYLCALCYASERWCSVAWRPTLENRVLVTPQRPRCTPIYRSVVVVVRVASRLISSLLVSCPLVLSCSSRREQSDVQPPLLYPICKAHRSTPLRLRSKGPEPWPKVTARLVRSSTPVPLRSYARPLCCVRFELNRYGKDIRRVRALRAPRMSRDTPRESLGPAESESAPAGLSSTRFDALAHYVSRPVFPFLLNSTPTSSLCLPFPIAPQRIRISPHARRRGPCLHFTLWRVRVFT